MKKVIKLLAIVVVAALFSSGVAMAQSTENLGHETMESNVNAIILPEYDPDFDSGNRYILCKWNSNYNR